MHYSKDVPGLIREAIEEADKNIDFKMLKPVGKHPDIFNLVQEILYEEVADQLEYKHVPPSMIEQRSMEMIENFLYGDHVPEDQKPVIKRGIHTTGDFDFMRSMVFHKIKISCGMNHPFDNRFLILRNMIPVQEVFNHFHTPLLDHRRGYMFVFELVCHLFIEYLLNQIKDVRMLANGFQHFKVYIFVSFLYSLFYKPGDILRIMHTCEETEWRHNQL